VTVVRAAGLVALLVAGCGLLPAGPAGGPYPEACARLGFDERRCAAIVARAREAAGIAESDVLAAEFVPDGGRSELGGYRLATVRLALRDGTDRTQEIWCVGITVPDDLVCHDDPAITIGGGVDQDVPCTGEPPAGCATLPPSPRADVVARAQPLIVPALDVPLDRVGGYEIRVGEAGLPDGALSDRSARLVDPRPVSYWIEGGVRIDVRPALADRPPVGSVYRDPHDGVEPVVVYLVFEVTDVSPGAVLQIRDIVVR